MVTARGRPEARAPPLGWEVIGFVFLHGERAAMGRRVHGERAAVGRRSSAALRVFVCATPYQVFTRATISPVFSTLTKPFFPSMSMGLPPSSLASGPTLQSLPAW